MIKFKINNEVKVIRKVNQDCNDSLELFIEKHKSNLNYAILSLNKNDIEKMLRILKF